jgi:hypothetical protein
MAGDPWKGRLPLVVPSDLEEVEEVGTAGVDFYGVLIGCGCGFGDF